MPKLRYAVQAYTAYDGWVNMWTTGGKPETFASRKEAGKALNKLFAYVKKVTKRETLLKKYSRAEFRIVEYKQEKK